MMRREIDLSHLSVQCTLPEIGPMLSKQDNELLTRIEGDAPMGRMLRQHHWVPAVRAGRLEAARRQCRA